MRTNFHFWDFFIKILAGPGGDSGGCPASGVPGYGGFAQQLQPGKENSWNKTKCAKTWDVIEQVQISFFSQVIVEADVLHGEDEDKGSTVSLFKMSSYSWTQYKFSLITGVYCFQVSAQIGLLKNVKALFIPLQWKRKFQNWKRAGTYFLILARSRKTCLCRLQSLQLPFPAFNYYYLLLWNAGFNSFQKDFCSL